MKNFRLISLTLLASSILISGCTNNASNTKLSEKEVKNAVLANLKKQDMDIQDISLSKTEIPYIYKLSSEGYPDTYVTSDGKYLIPSLIVNIDSKPGYEISQKQKSDIAAKEIKALDPNEFITFKAENEIHNIYVFTDVNCVYCREFHKEVSKLNESGITVNYLASPRNDNSKELMNKVWCSVSKKDAFSYAIEDKKFDATECDTPIEKHLELGKKLGVSGTPTIFLSNGQNIEGYRSADDLIGILKTI